MRKIDPLDVHAMVERWLLARRAGDVQSPATRDALGSTLLLFVMLSPYPTTGLEVAADYLNAGLWQDGTVVADAQVVESARNSPRLRRSSSIIWVTSRRN